MAKQDSADNTTGRANAADVSNVTPIDRARRTIESQVDTAKEKAAEVASEVGERLGDASATARRYSEKAKEQADLRTQQARETYKQVQSSMSEASGDLTVFVRDSPGRAVLIATAAGFLIGLLFRGRKS